MCLFTIYGVYKDAWLVEGAYAVPLIFGWLFFLFGLVMCHPVRKKVGTTYSSFSRKIFHAVYFICYPVWLVALVGLFLWSNYLLELRINTIFTNGPIAHATATVMEIDTRSSKTGTKYYAIIEYNTPEGTVRQAIKDASGYYKSGQKLTVKYAQQYPDMFKVEDAFLLP